MCDVSVFNLRQESRLQHPIVPHCITSHDTTRHDVTLRNITSHDGMGWNRNQLFIVPVSECVVHCLTSQQKQQHDDYNIGAFDHHHHHRGPS